MVRPLFLFLLEEFELHFSCSVDKNTKINNTYPFKIDQNYKGFTYIYIYIYILKEH